MLAFHFGPADRRLFGLYHEAGPGAQGRGSVLLCNPFGQEAVRTHRMYRVLADRLVRTGMNVMRFDYFGTGDSMGDDTQGEIEGWVRDTLAASAELSRRSAIASQVWLGARLGGTVALIAASRAPSPPVHLAIWEPVIDGGAYLQELAHATVAAFEASYTIRDSAWRQRLVDDAAQSERDGIGFEIGAALHEQLRQLEPTKLPVPSVPRATILKRDDSSAYASLLDPWRRHALTIDEIVLPHDFDWVAEEALNTSLVPHEIVQRLTTLAAAPA
jgi:alpha/beta superfamily hydrolase